MRRDLTYLTELFDMTSRWLHYPKVPRDEERARQEKAKVLFAQALKDTDRLKEVLHEAYQWEDAERAIKKVIELLQVIGEFSSADGSYRWESWDASKKSNFRKTRDCVNTALESIQEQHAICLSEARTLNAKSYSESEGNDD